MKKLETVFSVFLVGILLLPSFSFGQTNVWKGPTTPFSSTAPAPALPIDEGSVPQSKGASLLLPQLRLEDLSKLDSLKLETGSGISWGANSLSFNNRNLFNFIGEGIKLPSLGVPSLPIAGTIYYDSTVKEVKLYDGNTWKSIGSGAGGGSLLDTSVWTIGSGSVGNFIQNGPTDENIRVWGVDPHNKSSILWSSPNDATSDADGGWDYTGITIDKKKAYRSSIWIKRVGANNSGYIYLGADSSGGTVKLDNSPDDNPYFLVVEANKLLLDRWYLFVGYIHGSEDTSTNSYSGVYDGITGKKIINGTDFKNSSTATTQTHRTYNYYDTNSATVQYFWGPRFEELNGNESPIEALLGIPKSATSGNNAYFGSNINIGTADLGETLEISGGSPSRLQITETDTGQSPGLKLKYGAGTTKYWALSSSLVDARSSTFKISGGDGTDVILIKYNDDTGKGSINLAPDFTLCFNGGATPGTDCKKAWPTTSGGTAFNGLLQGPDLTLKAVSGTPNDPGDVVFQDFSGNQKARIWSKPSAGSGLFLSGQSDNTPNLVINSSGNVAIGNENPNARLDLSGATHQLWIDADPASSDVKSYNQTEPIVFHAGGAQVIARNAKLNASGVWERAKYGTAFNIGFGGGDESGGSAMAIDAAGFGAPNSAIDWIRALTINSDGSLSGGERLGWNSFKSHTDIDPSYNFYWVKVLKLTNANSNATLEFLIQGDNNYGQYGIYSLQANRFEWNGTKSVSLAVNKISGARSDDGVGDNDLVAMVDATGNVWVQAKARWGGFRGYKVIQSAGVETFFGKEASQEVKPTGSSWTVGISQYVRATFPELVKDESNSGFSDIVTTRKGNVGIGTSTPQEKLSVVGDVSVSDPTKNIKRIVVSGAPVASGGSYIAFTGVDPVELGDTTGLIQDVFQTSGAGQGSSRTTYKASYLFANGGISATTEYSTKECKSPTAVFCNITLKYGKNTAGKPAGMVGYRIYEFQKAYTDNTAFTDAQYVGYYNIYFDDLNSTRSVQLTYNPSFTLSSNFSSDSTYRSYSMMLSANPNTMSWVGGKFGGFFNGQDFGEIKLQYSNGAGDASKAGYYATYAP